jgi:M6 family metalloprotease-like protein
MRLNKTYSFFLIFILLVTASAGPSNNQAFKVFQPNGNSITLHGYGDEFFNYLQTEDGYTVIMNKSGQYVYAIRNNEGYLIPSDILVSEKGNREADEINFLNGIEKNILPRSTLLEEYNLKRIKTNMQRMNKNKSTRLFKTSQEPVHWNIAVLLIEFPDRPHTLSVEQVSKLFNEPGFEGGYGSPGSFNDYFKEISYGKFTITADVYGWYMADSSADYYSYANDNNLQRSGELVANALDQADAAGVDFSKYDNEGDNIIDEIIVIHSGLGAAQKVETKYIWAHQAALSQENRRVYDGDTLASYMIQEELQYNSFSDTNIRQAGIGLYVHEFGHALGLPDLYSVAGDNGNATVGRWCTMADGCWLEDGKRPSHFCGWCKEQLGWIQPEIVSSNGVTQFPAIDLNENGYKKFLLYSAPAQYFLVENRYKRGFDAALPGEGLVIFHIDNERSNRSSLPRKVDVEEADGLDELQKGISRGDNGDQYPGAKNNRTFDSFSYPSSRDYEGNLSLVSITDISNPGEVMTAVVDVQAVIDFTSDKISGHAPLEVQFENLTETIFPSANYAWDFETDYTIDSREENPVFTFNSPGKYNVSLEVSGSDYDNVKIKQNYIRVFDGFSALSFEEAASHAVVQANENLNLSGEFTIECWIKPSDWGFNINSGYETILSKNSIELGLQKYSTTTYNENSLTLKIKDANSGNCYFSTPAGSIILNEWQHVAITFKSSTAEVKMLINGLSQDLTKTGLMSGDVKDNVTDDLFIGNNASLEYGFQGQIDEVRVWNKAHSQLQIMAGMNQYFFGNENGLVSYWKMDEGTGNQFLDSRSSNNGNMFCYWEEGKALDPAAVGNEESNKLPEMYQLFNNYPNPFNPSTKIKFALPGSGYVKLIIYDILGSKVATLVDGNMPAGMQEISFNTEADFKHLVSGIYLYSLYVAGKDGSHYRATRKMILLK